MSGSEWAAMLSVVGVTLQLIGVALVVWDLRDAAELAREAGVDSIQPATPTAPVGRSVELRWNVEGTTSNIDAQVRQLAERITDELSQLGRQVDDIRNELNAFLLTTRVGQQQEIQSVDRAVRVLIQDLAGGHLWRRRSAAFFVILGTAILVAAATVQAFVVF